MFIDYDLLVLRQQSLVASVARPTTSSTAVTHTPPQMPVLPSDSDPPVCVPRLQTLWRIELPLQSALLVLATLPHARPHVQLLVTTLTCIPSHGQLDRWRLLVVLRQFPMQFLLYIDPGSSLCFLLCFVHRQDDDAKSRGRMWQHKAFISWSLIEHQW